jgi:hypothetical protein
MYKQWKHISGKLAVQFKDEKAVIFDSMGFQIESCHFESLRDEDWIELTPESTNISFQELYRQIGIRLAANSNASGNLADLGSEIGHTVGLYFKNMTDEEIGQFIFGFKQSIKSIKN